MSNGKDVDAPALSPRIVPVVWQEVGYSLAGVWDGAADRRAIPPQLRSFRAVFDRPQQRALIRRILEERHEARMFAVCDAARAVLDPLSGGRDAVQIIAITAKASTTPVKTNPSSNDLASSDIASSRCEASCGSQLLVEGEFMPMAPIVSVEKNQRHHLPSARKIGKVEFPDRVIQLF
ncbi:hypothetical protein OKW33_005416 [Paraburkholderia atlantica]|uniref:hypothetical protein n=1 Tax=Paraburkholderia atlantica TaxID=2654982 RepID=UPI003D1B78F9